MRRKLPLAIFFWSAGLGHLTWARRFFEDIVPPWLPGTPQQVNVAAGVAEITGGTLAVVPGAERFAKKYLIALLLAVFPANINMAVRPEDSKSAKATPRPLLWARLPLQFVAIAWVSRVLAQKQP